MPWLIVSPENSAVRIGPGRDSEDAQGGRVRVERDRKRIAEVDVGLEVGKARRDYDGAGDAGSEVNGVIPRRVIGGSSFAQRAVAAADASS